MEVSKEKRDEIRRSLVSAAVELFVAKEFSEVSLREMAKHANVAPGTAYEYFPDREQLGRAFFCVCVACSSGRAAAQISRSDHGTATNGPIQNTGDYPR